MHVKFQKGLSPWVITYTREKADKDLCPPAANVTVPCVLLCSGAMCSSGPITEYDQVRLCSTLQHGAEAHSCSVVLGLSWPCFHIPLVAL